MAFEFDKSSLLLRSVQEDGYTVKGTELNYAEGDGNFIALTKAILELQARGVISLVDFDGVALAEHDGKVLKYDHSSGKFILEEESGGGTGADESEPFTDSFTIDKDNVTQHKGKTYRKTGANSATVTFANDTDGYEIFFRASENSSGINFDFSAVTIINDETGEEGANTLSSGGMCWIWSDDGTTFRFVGELESNTPPTFSSVDFDSPVVGNVSGSDLVYQDEDNDLPDPDNYELQWKFAEDDGAGSPDMNTLTNLSGETGTSITVTEALEGKWLFLEAKAAALKGASPGDPVLSSGKKVSPAAAGLWDYTDNAAIKLALCSLRNTYSDEAGTQDVTSGSVACFINIVNSAHKFTELVEQPTLVNTSGTRGLRASGVTRMRAGDILDSLFNPTQITDKRTYVMLVQLDELNNNLLLSKDSGNDGFKIYPNQNRLKFTQADDRGAAYEVNSQVATDQAAGVPNDNIQGNVYLWSIEVEEDDDPQWAGHFRHRYYLGGDEINVGYVGTRGTGLSGGTAGAALQLFGGNASYITLFAFAGFEGKDTALRELLEQRMAYDHNMPSLLGQYSGSHTHDGGPATL